MSTFFPKITPALKNSRHRCEKLTGATISTKMYEVNTLGVACAVRTKRTADREDVRTAHATAMTGATVGKVGIMPRTNRRYYLNQRVGIFRPRYGFNPTPF